MILIYISNFELKSQNSPTEYLIFSVERGYINHTKKAIKAGGNVNARDYFKKTPLIYASETGNLEILSLLLKHGAATSINARDRDGKTALFYAKEKKFTKITEVLIQYGAKDE